MKLPEVYKRYTSVFSEEEVQRFPPSRPWNRVIDFKSRALDAIDCKVYPMTHTKDDTLDKFIDEQLAKGYICPLNFSLPLILLLHQKERQEALTGTRLPKH